jgi:HEAT repeat protein
VLGGLLGWNSSLDVSLLQQIARLAALGETASDPTLCGVVRGFLRSDEPGLACEAAIACGRLEDFDAADELVDLLESDERSVREASAWALGRLTGLAYQDDTQRWRAWLASEQAWLENEAPALIADLEHTDASRAIRCLGELSRRRYRRDELGAAMCVALDDERPEVRKLACTALARLGSKAVVPELIASLDDEDDEVTAAALAALRSITGMDLPAVSQVWKAADPARAGGR